VNVPSALTVIVWVAASADDGGPARQAPRIRADQRVIVITSYPGMLEQVDSLADLIMLKPVEIEDLTTLVSRLTQTRPKSYLFRDPASNLYTINFFMTRLEHAFARSKRNPEILFGAMAIQFRVKLQEDEQLYDEDCEQILKQIAIILNKDFRPTDTFGHLEGLRLAALYEDFKKPEDIFKVIHRLHQDLTLEIEIMERLWQVTPVIGAVLIHPRFQSPDEILKAAVNALEHAWQLTGEYYYVAEPPQT
jgi:GGDEF domain-containing protein